MSSKEAVLGSLPQIHAPNPQAAQNNDGSDKENFVNGMPAVSPHDRVNNRDDQEAQTPRGGPNTVAAFGSPFAAQKSPKTPVNQGTNSGTPGAPGAPVKPKVRVF